MVEVHLKSGHTVYTNVPFGMINEFWKESKERDFLKDPNAMQPMSFDSEVEKDEYKAVIDMDNVVAIVEGHPPDPAELPEFAKDDTAGPKDDDKA